MTFYIILIVMFSQFFCVLGAGNWKNTKEAFGKDAWPLVQETDRTGDLSHIADMAGKEYYFVGQWIGMMLSTLRISIGDNTLMGVCAIRGSAENAMFWICFIMTVGATCIVFLNFIVAEASNSYAIVTEILEPTIWMEKSNLISEAEDMTW